MVIKVTVAKIDNNNIYQGVVQINKTSIKSTHVLVDMDCDLKKGCYLWDSNLKTFVPTDEFIKQINDEKIFRFRSAKKTGES